jgi:hypothetical protein
MGFEQADGRCGRCHGYLNGQATARDMYLGLMSFEWAVSYWIYRGNVGLLIGKEKKFMAF